MKTVKVIYHPGNISRTKLVKENKQATPEWSFMAPGWGVGRDLDGSAVWVSPSDAYVRFDDLGRFSQIVAPNVSWVDKGQYVQFDVPESIQALQPASTLWDFLPQEMNTPEMMVGLVSMLAGIPRSEFTRVNCRLWEYVDLVLASVIVPLPSNTPESMDYYGSQPDSKFRKDHYLKFSDGFVEIFDRSPSGSRLETWLGTIRVDRSEDAIWTASVPGSLYALVRDGFLETFDGSAIYLEKP